MPSQYIRAKTGAEHGGSLNPPERVPDAEWQAGISADSHRFRVLLNGEPLPLAFAARAGLPGWVMCYRDTPERPNDNRGPQRRHVPEDAFGRALTVRVIGHVRIVEGDRV